MKRILPALFFVLILAGIFVYTVFVRNPSATKNPPIPQNQDINIPQLNPAEIEYREKMKEIEKKQGEERVQNINDIEIANKAISSGNKNDCSTVVNPETKTLCEDLASEALALEEKNISHCESINDEKKKTICKDKVYIIQASEKNDTVICDMISVDNLRSECFAKVETKKYLSQKQTSGSGEVSINCESFTNSGVIAQCTSDTQKEEDYTILSDALKRGNSSECSKISDKKIQNDCIDGVHFTLAKKTLSLKECDKIIDSERKSQCIDTVNKISDIKVFQGAIRTQSILDCEKITSATLRASCSDKIRISTIIESGDISDCSTLSDTSVQEACKNAISSK